MKFENLVFKNDLKNLALSIAAKLRLKADSNHTHVELHTHSNKSIIDNITNLGDGTKVLYDDGTYKTPGIPEIISDTIESSSNTYSSTKINELLENKADSNHTHVELHTHSNMTQLNSISNETFDILKNITTDKIDNWDDANTKKHTHANQSILDDITSENIESWNAKSHTHDNKDFLDTLSESSLHTHSNKSILDNITGSGDGTKVLYDDGAYKEITHKWDDILNRPFKQIGEHLTVDDEYKLDILYPIVPLTVSEYTNLETKDNNTIYVCKAQTDTQTSFIAIGDKTVSDVSEVTKYIINTGDGTKFLNDKREYVTPDYTSIISDNKIDNLLTYSSEKIEERLDQVQYDISQGTNNNLYMVQRTILDAKNGTNKYFQTSSDNSINKILLQPYKFVEGEQNIVQVLKTYDNSESENFNFNSNNISFVNGSMKIKDNYELSVEVYGDYFITNPFNKDDFLDIISINI